MTHSQKSLQQRKLYLAIPVLAFPFLTLTFWALGGGSGTPALASHIQKQGLNLELPDPHFAERSFWTKLDLYDEAARESARSKEARENDPYFDLVKFNQQKKDDFDSLSLPPQSRLIDSFPQKDRFQIDTLHEKVNRKLEQLMQAVNQPQIDKIPATKTPAAPIHTDPEFEAEANRLEKMMEMIHENNQSNPEMQQIENVLDKILDIQHPDRVKQKLTSGKTPTQHHPVEPAAEPENISVLNNQQSINGSALSALTSNGFFGLDDAAPAAHIGNAIQASIHGLQEVVPGATVKLRLLSDVVINGQTIPKDEFVYGTCAINNERLTIEINSLRHQNSIIDVSLSVFDLDGMEGIYVPGAITRDAAKQASDDALQNIQMMSLDPSLAAQAASAGIEAAKGLFSKKVKLVKVTLKAGYRVFLFDKNQNT